MPIFLHIMGIFLLLFCAVLFFYEVSIDDFFFICSHIFFLRISVCLVYISWLGLYFFRFLSRVFAV